MLKQVATMSLRISSAILLGHLILLPVQSGVLSKASVYRQGGLQSNDFHVESIIRLTCEDALQKPWLPSSAAH